MVLRKNVHAITEGNEAVTEGRNHKVRILARFNAITAEARQVDMPSQLKSSDGIY